MSTEKDILPLNGPIRSSKSGWKKQLAACIGVTLGLGIYSFAGQFSASSLAKTEELCPLNEKIDLLDYVYNKDTVTKLLTDEKFHLESAKKLAGAVQVPTVISDHMVNPNSTDSIEELYKLEPGWKHFGDFHEYLEKTFPLVHERLKVERVNTFGLAYTWEGKDSSKKPLLLLAHQDVVPVQQSTIKDWTYSPFSGEIADGKVWGRGASDCKTLLIALLDTIELLLSEGKFDPQRTIILSFGFDEESSGKLGAQNLSKLLLERYGPNSIYQIIDEGSEGYMSEAGVNFINPAIAEKGRLDSIIELYTPGGHSSIPPEHTSIGILSEFISLVEKTPFSSIITEKNPVLGQQQCVAEHGTLDKSLKDTILRAHVDKKANAALLDYLSSQGLGIKYLVTTSQAVDIVSGGEKANALPEHAEVLINSRIAVEESTDSVSKKFLHNLKVIAKRFDLGLYFDNEEIKPPTKNGYFNYTFDEPLEPAPISPVGSDVWNTFGGALRFFYEELKYPEDDTKFVFAPHLVTANTDTKWYWDLTPHIFRYSPSVPVPNNHIHSVDEFTSIEGHSTIIAFYYAYLQYVDTLA